MNKFRKFLVAGLCAVVLPCAGVLAGCDTEDPVSISSIEKTSSEGLVDTYTIYYTDGTTSTFTITNGKDSDDGHSPVVTISDDGYWVIDGEKTTTKAEGTDGSDGDNGKDGKDLTIDEVYAKYCEEYGDVTYEEFLKQYLSFNMGDNSVTIANCLRSVLKVYSEHYVNTVDMWGQKTGEDLSWASGSAVIYSMGSEYSYVVTNYHVVFNSSANTDNALYAPSQYIAKSIHGYLYGSEGGPTYDGTSVDSNGYAVLDYGNNALKLDFVGGSIEKDLAVLKVRTSDILAINPDATAVTLAEGYSVGDTAIAIGNPEDEGISVTEGIISVDGERVELDIDGDGTTLYYPSLRIDTSIYHGSSGGGLFNADGELIAIANAGNEEDEHINYAIPLNIVKSTVENIIYYHEESDSVVSPQKIVIGVNGVNILNSRYVYDESTGSGKIVETISIVEVASGSIAETIGLQAGDILNSIYINNVEYKLNKHFEISDVMLMVRVGDVIKVNYTRDSNTTDSSTYTILTTDLTSVS